MRPLRIVVAAALLSIVVAGASAQAASLQSIGNFSEPIYVTSDPGNAGRLFVVERAGRILQVQGGITSTFADLRTTVGCVGECSGERGLLSIAPAPDFDDSGRLYADYAKDTDGTIHVAELRANGATAPLSSLRDVLVIPHPGQSNHNGGQLQFGPEGNLFISTGDGGGSDDQLHNAQDLTKPLGKILRIDPAPAGVLPYTIPAGNPFAGVGSDYAPIWSYGLRNPFRFSFDRASGALVIGDVGQDEREEVDYAPAPGLGAGANYGWNCREGLIEGPADDPGCSGAPPGSFVDPIFDYPHTIAPGGTTIRRAIIGGYVVHDPSLPELAGRYLYGDLSSGEVRSLSLTSPFGSDRSEQLGVANLNSFGEDACGRIYAVSGSGPVYRLVGPQPTPCQESPTTATLERSYVGIKALRRTVQRGRRALITTWVSPCRGRVGERVTLLRGRTRLGTRRLDRACTARFKPQIHRRQRFAVRIAADSTYVAATSRRLGINPRRRARLHRSAR
jgi:glucose/arabinose dehydrogenase